MALEFLYKSSVDNNTKYSDRLISSFSGSKYLWLPQSLRFLYKLPCKSYVILLLETKLYSIKKAKPSLFLLIKYFPKLLFMKGQSRMENAAF